MAKKRKSDRPKHVSIYYDQILYDLDFMPDEYAGIILKMIVWYASGTDEGKQRIEEMKKRIASLPDKGWLTGIYKRLFNCIDEDFSTYAEICEKRRVLALEREERKRNERAQVCTSDHKCAQVTTSDHLTDTDTDTDTELSKDNNNNNSHSSHTHARETDVFDDAWDSEQWRSNVCMRHDLKPPELERKWKEFMMHRKASGKRNDSIADIREHFNLWLLHDESGTASKQYISRDERNKREADARKQRAADHIAKLASTCT